MIGVSRPADTYSATGLRSYLTEKKITKGFVEELKTVASIIYFQSRPALKISLEEFQSHSYLQVLEALPYFSPEKGLINDFVYTVVLNLSRSLKQHLFPETAGEIFDETGTIFSYCFTSSYMLTYHQDLNLRSAILRFAKYAESLYIHINQHDLYLAIISKEFTPLVQAFLLFYQRNADTEGNLFNNGGDFQEYEFGGDTEND